MTTNFDYTGTPPFANATWANKPGAMCLWCAGTGHPHGDPSRGICKCPDVPRGATAQERGLKTLPRAPLLTAIDKAKRAAAASIRARAEAHLRATLKPGDRLRVSKCPGTLRWITFAGWDGRWIVSKSGINDYSPASVDRVNGVPVDFTSENEAP